MNTEKKPKLLDRITALMALFNLSGFLMITDEESTRLIEIAVISIVIAIIFLVLYKFNKGYNWARILVLIASGIALFNLVILLNYGVFAQIVVMAQAVLATYLLYWLNIENVKNYFMQNHNN